MHKNAKVNFGGSKKCIGRFINQCNIFCISSRALRVNSCPCSLGDAQLAGGVWGVFGEVGRQGNVI